MRTILVATAASALALGSLTGAAAAPGHKSNPKPVLQVVNIVGHTPLNVFKVNEDGGTTMSVRPLTLRATVRYNSKAPLETLTVYLDAYSKKVGGKELDGFDAIKVDLSKKLDTTSKVNTFYWATHAFTVDEAKAMKTLRATSKAWLCISKDITGYDFPNGWDWSTQTRNRLGLGKGKPVRECVKIIDINPVLTDTTKDDPKPLP